MSWRLILIIIVAAVAPSASMAEDSVVLAQLLRNPPLSHAYCSTHSNCADLQSRWIFRVQKQLRGPRVPHKVTALLIRYDTFPAQHPPIFEGDEKSTALVVLTPIADDSLRKKTGASYLISDLSFTAQMFCLAKSPVTYGLHTPENETYVSPGAEKQCFDIVWADSPE
jgi:hypothetical protein